MLRGAYVDSRVLRIGFDAVSAYRSIEESYLIKFDRSDSGELSRYGLFTIADSEYLDWFLCVSQAVQPDVTHYAIYLHNQCLDVISRFPPESTWLQRTTEVGARLR